MALHFNSSQPARPAKPGLLRTSQAVELKPLTAVIFCVLFHGSKYQLRAVVWKWHVAPSTEKSVALQQHSRQLYLSNLPVEAALERMSSLPSVQRPQGVSISEDKTT